MPTTTVKGPSRKRGRQARRQALQPYLDKLESWIVQAADVDPDRPAKINVGQRAVTLEPWDRQQLTEFFLSGGQPVPELAELMAHAVACVLRTIFDVERLKRDEQRLSADLYALQAELMLDTALGLAILEETQVAIDRLVQQGRVPDARALSQFRHQIKHAIGEARKRIADSEVQQAEELSVSMRAADPPQETVPGSPSGATERGPAPRLRAPSLDGGVETVAAELAGIDPVTGARLFDHVDVEIDDEPAAAPARAPARAPASSPRAKSRSRKRSAAKAPSAPGLPSLTPVLCGVLVGLAGFWAATVWHPSRTVAIPHLTTAELPMQDKLDGVHAAPPSLYITVNEAAWEQMTESDRTTLIDAIGTQANRVGYSGLLLRTPNGRPVARWLKLRGPELVLAGEKPSAPAIGSW